MTPGPSESRMTRRTALKNGALTSAVLVGSSAIAGSAAFAGTTRAHPKPHDHDVFLGDDVDYLDGVLRTYATTDPQGALSSLGYYMDADALAAFDEDPLEHHLQFPDEVDTRPFTFAGVDYVPHGHEPPDVYDVPHFDFHFYMIPEDVVEAIPAGPATYSIPDARMPSGYQRLPALDTDGDGDPDTPAVEEDMGEHLADVSSREFQADGEFTHTMIYGAYDVDGDGTGRLTFVEPMVTVEFLAGLEEETVVEIGTPEAFAEPGSYPTQYVIEPALHGGAYVSIDGFTEFPGPTGGG